MEELNRLSVEEFKEAPKIPVCIALDNIRSMHNVGSAFRTGDAFRIEKIILGGITAQPPHREINKTALGATASVEWEYSKDLTGVLRRLKTENYKIVSVEQATQSVHLQHFAPLAQEKYCFVFGNEVFGVSEEILQLADACLEIPQFGAKHSLNISVSVGIIIWDYYQKVFLTS